MTTQHIETLIIGAGQAGLATGYHLKQLGREFLILDGNARVGDNWRCHSDSLRLFTPAKYDGGSGPAVSGRPMVVPRQGRRRRLHGDVCPQDGPAGAAADPESTGSRYGREAVLLEPGRSAGPFSCDQRISYGPTAGPVAWFRTTERRSTARTLAGLRPSLVLAIFRDGHCVATSSDVSLVKATRAMATCCVPMSDRASMAVSPGGRRPGDPPGEMASATSAVMVLLRTPRVLAVRAT